MKKQFQIGIILLAVVLIGCKDELIEDITSKGAKDMTELRVASDFEWTTSKTIDITITGLPALSYMNAVKNTLYIKSEDKIYYTGSHTINENLRLSITIPSTETKIQLKFGSIEKETAIENNKVTFSFIPTITDEK
jgi:hypothetical protein